jgi:hypothetical protein
MVLQILEVGKQFRPKTSHVYPPFKNGRYMEEYVYEYLISNKDEIKTDLVYIPIFWTNLQISSNFESTKNNYNILLQTYFKKMDPTTKYFTVVQHDDGPLLTLPKNTIIFGACTGTIPLPLIYEDQNQLLLQLTRIPFQQKDFLASFIGTSTTHPLRQQISTYISNKKDIYYFSRDKWSEGVVEEDKKRFIEVTMRSKFCLAPRGYGRSSFRFFEAMLMDIIPIYFWNDFEWLPYKELLNYSKFSISIHQSEIHTVEDKLRKIGEEEYGNMMEELRRVRHYFTLEGMSEYIVKRISEV